MKDILKAQSTIRPGCQQPRMIIVDQAATSICALVCADCTRTETGDPNIADTLDGSITKERLSPGSGLLKEAAEKPPMNRSFTFTMPGAAEIGDQAGAKSRFKRR